ncbi:MAG: AMP-binding protein [Actinomycetes bacterium]|jgi:acyl-CoA synthetase (AMP-forming)/AMP-acid ligase II
MTSPYGQQGTEPQTIGEIPTMWATREPGLVALRSKAGAERTYLELDERTNRLANGFYALGLRPGDRLVAWMSDSFACIDVYLAAAKAGLVVCPLNSRLTAHEADYLVRDSDPRALVWTADLDQVIADLAPELVAERVLLRVSEEADCQLEQLIEGSPSDPPAIEVDPDSTFIIGYTSGTTGKPKGAELTHRSILAIARINATSYRLTAYPRFALTGSMSFVAVIPAHVLCTLRMGGCLTIMGKWTMDELLDVLERDLITFTYIPSPLMSEAAEALARRPEAWTNLRSVLHSASRARPDQLHALVQVIGSRLVEGWGMTENSGGLMSAMLGHEYLGAGVDDPVFTSVGRAVLDISVRVIGPDGADLPHDGETVGELIFAAPSLMSGYHNRPQETASALQDGWFHTGDLGSMDAEGYIYISDRRTDLIVSGGANVYPSEVEECIAAIPGVRDVAVVGLPHERWGQTVVAVVVRDGSAAGIELTSEVIIERCRTQLASYKKPTQVTFVDSLPRTASLKISRASVRTMAQSWTAND